MGEIISKFEAKGVWIWYPEGLELVVTPRIRCAVLEEGGLGRQSLHDGCHELRRRRMC